MVNLGSILKSYRLAHGLTQSELASRLNCDQTYISKVEKGHRTISNIVDLRRIAERLGMPPQALGLARYEGLDKPSDEILDFAPPIIELSELTRNAGNAPEAIRSLSPLVTKLEFLATKSQGEQEVLQTLALAETALATALGDRLPSNRLASSVALFQRAWERIKPLKSGDRLKNLVFRRYGNELRKVGQLGSAVSSLKAALEWAPDIPAKGALLIGLARAFARMGNHQEFDEAVTNASRLLPFLRETRPTFNPVVVEEIRLRGLLTLKRLEEINTVLKTEPAAPHNDIATAAQWRAMSSITHGAAQLATGESEYGFELIERGLIAASKYQLPQQIQRAIRYLKPMAKSSRAKRLVSQAHQELGALNKSGLEIVAASY